MFRKLIDELVQRRVRFGVVLLRPLLCGEEQTGARGRPAAGVAIDHLLILLRRIGRGQERDRVAGLLRVVKQIPAVAEPAEHQHDGDGDDRRLVLIPEEMRLESGVGRDLG